jgi:hypothetical protein
MRSTPPTTPTRLLLALFALGATSSCARLDELWGANADRPPPLDDDALSVRVDLGADAASADAPETFTAPEPPPLPAAPDAATGVDGSVDAAADSDASADASLADGGDAPAAIDTRPTITGLALRTGIVEAPTGNSRWVGYVRAGGRVAIVRGPLGNEGCPARRDVPGAGWYQVEGGGYVCVGYLAALTTALERTPRRFPAQPDLDASMPFLYGITQRAGAMYRWAPSSDDERAVEPERFVQRSAADGAVDATADDAAPADDASAPAVSDASAAADAAAGDGSIRIEDLEGVAGSPLLRRVLSRMYVSLDRELRAPSGSTYWHTQSGGYVRAGTVGTLRTGPTFQGVRLDAPAHLPVAFAISNITPLYRQVGTAMTSAGRAPRLQFLQLTGDAPVRLGTEEYHRTADGLFVRSRNVRIVTTHEPPVDLTPGEKWIDVNLDHQSMVAYEGTTPVYVTVVSTGLRRRSLTENYETIQGAFRIQSKHVATTMDGNSNDGPYSIEDVPWVMYFEQSFALHGAFWHNGFGIVHSHGCVNLSPPDARFLFFWSEPRVPAGWHGAYATPQVPGTRVFVHYDAQALGERGGPVHIPTH